MENFVIALIQSGIMWYISGMKWYEVIVEFQKIFLKLYFGNDLSSELNNYSHILHLDLETY